MNLQQQFVHGMSLHQAGRLAEAEKIYREVLSRRANHADALHLLGVLAGQTGHFDDSVNLIRRAISINPNDAAYFSNLSIALQRRGQFEEAIASYREAVRLKPGFAEAYSNLGGALATVGRSDEAIDSFRRSTRGDDHGVCELTGTQFVSPLLPTQCSQQIEVSIGDPGFGEEWTQSSIDARNKPVEAPNHEKW